MWEYLEKLEDSVKDIMNQYSILIVDNYKVYLEFIVKSNYYLVEILSFMISVLYREFHWNQKIIGTIMQQSSFLDKMKKEQSKINNFIVDQFCLKSQK